MNSLWLSQARGILRLEFRKNLVGMRAAPIYLLSLMPLAVVGLFVLVSSVTEVPGEMRGTTGASRFFAALYEFILAVVVYFGCVWVFMNLFRGEVLDRSLHYYFLAPVRRSVLVAGKFVAAWAVTSFVFCTTVIVCFLVIFGYLGGPESAGFLTRGPGMGQLPGYVGVTLLACLGYGAVFLVVGLFFRSPVVPALLIFLWEGINFLLPAALKKASVIFYLKSMLPVPTNNGMFAVLAEPVPVWIAVGGLLVFTAAILGIAALRIRRMEISYASD